MGNSNLNQNENILVVVDQQNIVHVDPNTIIDQNGQLQSRLVDHENLVMYVNLEADLVPRSIFYSDSEKNTLTSLASGTFNMMRNQGDKNEFENNFDTNWTETFVPISSKQDTINAVINAVAGTNLNRSTTYDPSAQTFGIESINIVVKGPNNIPQVSINFLDVRGKTLFDSPDNSPYKAFFHQPWPIFYLTVKGFYGKAIRYRLHLTKFTSKYNGSNGNLFMGINTDTTASNYVQAWYGTSGTTYFSGANVGVAGVNAILPGNNGYLGSNSSNIAQFTIYEPNLTTRKLVTASSAFLSDSSTNAASNSTCDYVTTSALSSVQLKTTVGSFTAGTVLVYGVK